jgi:ADP-ribose pyrophosphatase
MLEGKLLKKYEKTLETNYLFQGKVVNLRIDRVKLPNGKESVREVVEHAGAVGIVPVSDDNKIILVKQFRKALDQEIIEIPAGKLDPGERPADCAQRELQEEIGFKSGRLEFKFSCYTSPGFSNEIIHIFIARDLQESRIKCDDDEFITTLEVSLQEALHMIKNGMIKDAKSISGILALLLEDQDEGFLCRDVM